MFNIVYNIIIQFVYTSYVALDGKTARFCLWWLAGFRVLRSALLLVMTAPFIWQVTHCVAHLQDWLYRWKSVTGLLLLHLISNTLPVLPGRFLIHRQFADCFYLGGAKVTIKNVESTIRVAQSEHNVWSCVIRPIQTSKTHSCRIAGISRWRRKAWTHFYGEVINILQLELGVDRFGNLNWKMQVKYKNKTILTFMSLSAP